MRNKELKVTEEFTNLFDYELHNQEDVFSDKKVAKICELIEKKALVFSKF